MAEYQYINFWRVKKPMKFPCKRLPLTVLDPNTIKREEIIGYDATNGGIPEYIDQLRFLMLKYNPAHKWYFYPDQTIDEVLVFK